MRRRHGINNFERTEGRPDPLGTLGATLYDVVRHDEAWGEEAGRGTRAAAQRAWRERDAAAQFPEGTLLCNYMPMVREYLAEQQQAQQAKQEGAGGTAPMAVEGEGEGGEGEYVYDLYAAAGSDDEAMVEGGEGGRQAAQRWLELAAEGRATIVRIVDDENWLVVEAEDEEDSDAGSEDSNAEGFYANDYPDEPTDSDVSDDEHDDAYDADGFVGGERWRMGGMMTRASSGSYGPSDDDEDYNGYRKHTYK